MEDVHIEHVEVGDTIAKVEAEVEAEDVESPSNLPSLLGEAPNLGVINENNGQIDHAESLLRRQVGQ